MDSSQKSVNAAPQQVSAFFELFKGHPDAHYTRDANDYHAVNRGLTLADVDRHLVGTSPSVLAIPILPDGNCHFGAIDIDRHGDADVPVDHAELARQITRLGLPLVVTRSKSPKSAHVWLFFKDSAGFSAAPARRLLGKYISVLGLTGEYDLFPIQEELKDGKMGNGINLPFFGKERRAFGCHGEPLDLDGFIALAQERRSFGQLLADRDLTTTPGASTAPSEDRPLPLAIIRQLHQKNLAGLRAMLPNTGRNNELNKTAFFAARAFAAHALEGSESDVKQAIRAAALACGLSDDEITQTGASGWHSGIGRPLSILDPERDHDAALARIDVLLADENASMNVEDGLRDAALLKVIEFEPRRKRLAARLGFSRPTVFDQEIARCRAAFETQIDPAKATRGEIRSRVEELLDENPTEGDRKEAENLIWEYLSAHAQVFCCGGGGYLLLRNGDGVPVAVTRDGEDFNRLLTEVGIHSGSPTRNRVGAFIQTKCYHDGIQTDTRLSFHFEPSTFAAYIAYDRGRLVKVTRFGFDEVPNGTDGQLFVFPTHWQALLTKSLDEIGGVIGADDAPPSDRITHALFPDGYLTAHLFSDTRFEIRSMSEKQVRILVMAYVLFLMMPGIVSERALLQTLGPSGSGKTFLLDYLGHLLMGQNFTVRALPTDIREFENQIINEYFIAYDNVSHIPRDIRDRFCQAVTGMEVVRRELFTTSREARHKSKATISLSAITPPLPELEHQNRTVTINFTERTEGTFIAKEELFSRLSHDRNELIVNLIRRATLVLEALFAQRDYVPKVNVRLASVATFILRIARHEGWEVDAKKLLGEFRLTQ